MKWIGFCGAFVVIVSLTASAQAGVFNDFSLFGKGDSKCCGSNSDCQPQSCKPVIKRPCEFTCYTFQRKVCTKPRPCSKPDCCTKGGGKHNCCKVVKKCPKPTKACVPKTTACCPTKTTHCTTDRHSSGKKHWFNFRCFKRSHCDTGTSCFKKDPGCGSNHGHHGNCQQECCNADPCEIAELIYDSQTACYAKDRRKAISRLGRFDCSCNPEIMVAFVYALNDAVETVRAEAADEIGDQLRNNPCCCSKELAAALTVALADCDKNVRRQAEEALEACGYEVVDGCCDSGGTCCKDSHKKSCCDTKPGCADHGNTAPTPIPQKKSDKAPPPPGKGDIYFNTPTPSRKGFTPEWESTSSKRSQRNRRLSNLFGLLK